MDMDKQKLWRREVTAQGIVEKAATFRGRVDKIEIDWIEMTGVIHPAFMAKLDFEGKSQIAEIAKVERVRVHALLVASAAGRKRGKFIVIYAAGYLNPYKTVKDEIAAIDGNLSTAWSADFKKTAEDTRSRWGKKKRSYVAIKTYAAKKNAQFFGTLEKVQGPFRRIAFIGHGSSQGISFSGHGLDAWETLEIQDLDDRKINIDKFIKPKLLAETTIDLYACSVAAKKEFAQAMANAFGCRVRAFKKPLVWCVSHDGTKIISRGRIATYAASGKFRREGRIPNCKENIWKGVNDLIPTVVVDPE